MLRFRCVFATSSSSRRATSTRGLIIDFPPLVIKMRQGHRPIPPALKWHALTAMLLLCLSAAWARYRPYGIWKMDHPSSPIIGIAFQTTAFIVEVAQCFFVFYWIRNHGRSYNVVLSGKHFYAPLMFVFFNLIFPHVTLILVWAMLMMLCGAAVGPLSSFWFDPVYRRWLTWKRALKLAVPYIFYVLFLLFMGFHFHRLVAPNQTPYIPQKISAPDDTVFQASLGHCVNISKLSVLISESHACDMTVTGHGIQFYVSARSLFPFNPLKIKLSPIPDVVATRTKSDLDEESRRVSPKSFRDTLMWCCSNATVYTLDLLDGSLSFMNQTVVFPTPSSSVLLSLLLLGNPYNPHLDPVVYLGVYVNRDYVGKISLPRGSAFTGGRVSLHCDSNCSYAIQRIESLGFPSDGIEQFWDFWEWVSPVLAFLREAGEIVLLLLL